MREIKVKTLNPAPKFLIYAVLKALSQGGGQNEEG